MLVSDAFSSEKLIIYVKKGKKWENSPFYYQ